MKKVVRTGLQSSLLLDVDAFHDGFCFRFFAECHRKNAVLIICRDAVGIDAVVEAETAAERAEMKLAPAVFFLVFCLAGFFLHGNSERSVIYFYLKIGFFKSGRGHVDTIIVRRFHYIDGGPGVSVVKLGVHKIDKTALDSRLKFYKRHGTIGLR